MMMRQVVGVVFLTLLLLSSVRAEGIRHYGVTGGITISNHIVNDESNYSDCLASRVGMNAGIYAEWPLISPLTLMTRLTYVQKGADLRYEEITYEYPLGSGRILRGGARIDCFSLDLLGKIRFGRFPWSPYLMGGPRFDLLINRKMYDWESLYWVYIRYDKFVLGLTAAVGVDFPLPWAVPRGFLELSYVGDLVNSYEHHYSAPGSSDEEIKNSAFNILLGFGY